MNLLIVDQSRCTKCGTCIKECPAGIVEFGEDGYPRLSESRAGRCIDCGQCVLFCPSEADVLSSMNKGELVSASEVKMPGAEEALNLLKTRRSIRIFKNEPLPRGVFEKIFDAVRQAPTAVNSQNVRWIVTENPDKTKEVVNLVLCWMREEIFKNPASPAALLGAAMIAKAKVGEDAILRGAPHIAVAVVPKSYKWPEDGVIALTYLELAAHALGVGCCWGGYLMTAVRNFKGLRDYLGIGDDEYMCGAQMMGTPAVRASRQYAPRREMQINWIA